eukprot:2206780-Alexandrium_andersonii.AAC.1
MAWPPTALGTVERDGVRRDEADVARLRGGAVPLIGGSGSAATTGAFRRTSSSAGRSGGLGGAQRGG